MSEWKKLKTDLMDFVKSCDDTPTEEQNRVYDLLVGGLIAEGDKLYAVCRSLIEHNEENENKGG